MENRTPIESNSWNGVESKEEDEEEDVSESFICCVCLDLLYKPIVLPCGHVSCFWCVHKSMNNIMESHCPFCRHTYHHFPTICQMLHFLLLKMYPLAYKRRESQILEEENESGYFSPQLDGDFPVFHTDKGSTSLSESGIFFFASSTSNGPSVPCSIEDKLYSDLQETHSGSQLRDSGGISTSKGHNSPHISGDEISNDLSIVDVFCSSCKQLLFRPAVLNCGHVYCETCITVLEDETIKCQLCECRHPSSFPKVCLEFCNFLEEKFPEEYAARRDAVNQRSMQCQALMKDGKQAAHSSSLIKERGLPWKREDGLKIHFGVGCDCCGIFPIVGDRYRCKDCVEAIGFDLCGDCYNTRSKVPGRFNQQHTADHQFEHVKPQNLARNILLRFIASQMEDGSPFSIQYAVEDSEEDATTPEILTPLNTDVHTAPAEPDVNDAEDENHEQPMFCVGNTDVL